MFRHELSTLLLRVLDAVHRRPNGIHADAAGEPEPHDVAEIALDLGEDYDDVKQALEGLRHAHCLVEHELDFPGMEPVVWWTVHPQVAATAAPPTGY